MNDNSHADILDLLPLYVLDGLEPAEGAQVAAHLSGCASCTAEHDRLAALISNVAASVPARAPDPALRAKILQRATGAAPAPVQARPVASRPPARPAVRPAAPARRPSLSLWLARATTALALLLIVWNVLLTTQLQTLRQQVDRDQQALAIIAAPGTTEIALAGQTNFESANGKAFVDSQSGQVVVVVQNLQPLSTDKTYQAWIITDAGARSAGLFQVNNTGLGIASLDLPYVPGGAIGISLEPSGGSPQPTQVVLVGS